MVFKIQDVAKVFSNDERYRKRKVLFFQVNINCLIDKWFQENRAASYTHNT